MECGTLEDLSPRLCRGSAGEQIGREFRGPAPGLGPASGQGVGCRRTCVPDPNSPVPASRGEEPAVRAERHAGHAGRMPTEGEDFLFGHHIPQLDGPIVAPRGQAPTVRTGGQTIDEGGVSVKVEHSPRGKVTDLHFTELTLSIIPGLHTT